MGHRASARDVAHAILSAVVLVVATCPRFHTRPSRLTNLNPPLPSPPLRMMIFRRDLDRNAVGGVEVHPIAVSPGVEV